MNTFFKNEKNIRHSFKRPEPPCIFVKTRQNNLLTHGGRFNQMHAFFEKSLSQQRVQPSSELSALLRKVRSGRTCV